MPTQTISSRIVALVSNLSLFIGRNRTDDLDSRLHTDNVERLRKGIARSDGADVDDDIINAAKRYPMMSEHQVVVVKEAQAVRNMEELSYYLQKPLHSTILVICHKHGTLDRRRSWPPKLKRRVCCLNLKR